MDGYSFQHIVQMIEHDPVFDKNSNNPQDPISLQLHYALYKLGHDGSAVGYIEAASKWGVSKGHVYNTTSRVVEALCNLKDTVICWPSTRKRRYESMSNDAREGFLEAVGKIDGMDIVLKYKPGGNYNEVFFTRKKVYALDLCAVCDSDKRFTYILAGWPNSQHDARIFASSTLHRSPTDYFLPGEYLLGDAAYTNTNHLISPYKASFTQERSNRRFNQKLSSVELILNMLLGF